MTLKEYVLGRWIMLQSPHRKEKVAERINQAAASMFSPTRTGVAGGIYWGRVRLAWRHPLFHNGFQPIFAGRIVEQGSKTQMRASFGAPLFLQIFYGLWYSFLVFYVVSAAAQQLWPMVGFGLIFALVPLAFHFVFNRNAEVHLTAILDLLEREAGFVPVDQGPAARR